MAKRRAPRGLHQIEARLVSLLSGQRVTDTTSGFQALNRKGIALFARDYPTWNVQVNVTYPIGTSSQEASYARAQLQSNQVEAQLRQIELQIATDVTNAATQVQNNVERVQAAQSAREFAQKQYEAEQVGRRAGTAAADVDHELEHYDRGPLNLRSLNAKEHGAS